MTGWAGGVNDEHGELEITNLGYVHAWNEIPRQYKLHVARKIGNQPCYMETDDQGWLTCLTCKIKWRPGM